MFNPIDNTIWVRKEPLAPGRIETFRPGSRKFFIYHIEKHMTLIYLYTNDFIL